MKKQTPTILVVEDDLDDQFILTRGFKKIGVSTPIHVMGNGLEAIAYMMGEGKFANRTDFAYPRSS
jgi:CheY-like chemotaxis protein